MKLFASLLLATTLCVSGTTLADTPAPGSYGVPEMNESQLSGIKDFWAKLLGQETYAEKKEDVAEPKETISKKSEEDKQKL